MEWWQREARLTGRGYAQVKECGADANAVNEKGRTAVMAAAHAGHTATAVALVRAVLLENDGSGLGGCSGDVDDACEHGHDDEGVCVYVRICVVWEGVDGRVGGNVES